MSKNGVVTFLADSESVGRTAVKDVAAFATAAAGGPTAPRAIGAAGISAAATVASALGTAGLFGVGLAENAQSTERGEMEIEITNSSSQAVVVYGYNSNDCDITNVPEPLAPGESDVFVITREKAFDKTTQIQLDMMIGGAETTCIESSIVFKYTTDDDPGRWAFQATIDGEPSEFKLELQLFGATFVGNTGYPSFSLYTGTTETANGSLSVSIYDHSADKAV